MNLLDYPRNKIEIIVERYIIKIIINTPIGYEKNTFFNF